jgi:hypothetical protein
MGLLQLVMLYIEIEISEKKHDFNPAEFEIGNRNHYFIVEVSNLVDAMKKKKQKVDHKNIWCQIRDRLGTSDSILFYLDKNN